MGVGGMREEATRISRWTVMVVGSGVGSLLCRLFPSFHRFSTLFSLLSPIHLLPTSRLVWAKNMFFENHEHQWNRIGIFQVYTSISFGELISLHRLYALKMIFDRKLENRFFYLLLFHLLSSVSSNSQSLSRIILQHLLNWSTLLFPMNNMLLNLHYSVLYYRINFNKFWFRRQ